MSQIVEAFIVPSAAMAQAAACCERGDRPGMRAALAPHEFESFAWSGYVIVVLVEWLREQSIELPRSADPVAARLVNMEDPLLCAPASEMAQLVAQLGGLNPTSDELARYWREFAADVPEAAEFMADAWSWLNRVASAGAEADWCVMFEG